MSSSASIPKAPPAAEADLAEAAPPAPQDPATASNDETARRRPKGKDLKPLRGLVPFVARYRGTVILALIALVASTAVTAF